MTPSPVRLLSPSPVRLLSEHCGGQWTAKPLAASSFCSTWRVEGGIGPLFVKSLPILQAEVLMAEADGLAALAATATVRVPAVVGCWSDNAQGLAVLAMQWLDLKPVYHSAFGERLGQALAQLHQITPNESAGRFGWRRNNMLGGTPQRNRWSATGGVAGWTAFFGSERLGALRDRLCLAGASVALLSTIDRVIAALPSFFEDGYLPRPVLVHGDLWSGNWASTTDGAPVVYDPAVSASDGETDLAMMELFGVPPPGFWPAYREAAGLAPGYPRRRGLYQLYHLLNHELLFGGYAQQALSNASKLLGRA